MSIKTKSIILTCLTAVLLFGFSAFSWLKPQTEFSLSERRALKSLPPLSFQTIFSGEFMRNFEEYTTDQFPLRDHFRTLKAVFSTKILNRLDNNGLYYKNGHLSKIEYPKNEAMLKYSINHFKSIYEAYMKDTAVTPYFCMVPDKNFILAKENGYPALDYENIAANFKNELDFATHIDILPLLSLEDYYTTDSHWRQEKITDIAKKIAASMGTDISASYTVKTLDNPFYGVFHGQSALKVEPDALKYLINDDLKNVKVTYFDDGMPKEGDLYDMEKATGKDPYEMFLSGTKPLITIENENARTNKELIVFRDSFGSSLTPLLSAGYKKITVIDTRYIQSNFIGSFVEFNNQDVLFLYSTVLLNNSLAMK